MKAKLPIDKIIQGNCIEILEGWPAESVDFTMFSPPYWGLRDYGKQTETVWDGREDCEHEWAEKVIHQDNLRFRDPHNKSGVGGHRKELKSNPNIQQGFCVKCGAWRGQLGLEPHFQMYVNHMVQVCRAVKRVLKKTGSMYLVLGDTYYSAKGKSAYAWSTEHAEERQKARTTFQRPHHQITGKGETRPQDRKQEGLKPKCLIGIPWRVAIALIDDGWILRNDNIWHKPNHMPDSVKDRRTKSHEYVFHFVKQGKYYYDLDAIRQPHKSETLYRVKLRKGKKYQHKSPYKHKNILTSNGTANPKGKNPGDVIKTKHDIAVGRTGNVAYTDPLHVKAYHSKGKNPGDVITEKYPPHEPRMKQLRNMKIRHGGHSGKEVRHDHPLGKNPGDIIKAQKLREEVPFIHHQDGHVGDHPNGKNPGDFMSVNTKPFKGAHFAVYPEALCEDLIKSSCPDLVCSKCGLPKNSRPRWCPSCKCAAPKFEPGIVLDIMVGSGTTCVVALKNDRHYIGIELPLEYVKMARKQIADVKKTIKDRSR